MQRSNSTENLVNYKNRGNSVPHHHNHPPIHPPIRGGANSVKLCWTIFETLTVRRKDRKEEYTVITEISKARMMDPKTGHEKPMTGHQLVRYFRSMAKKGQARYIIEHKNGAVERYDPDDPISCYERYDPKKEAREIQKWLKEHPEASK